MLNNVEENLWEGGDVKSCASSARKVLEREWCLSIIDEIERWRIQLRFPSISRLSSKDLNACSSRRAQSEDYYFRPRPLAFFSLRLIRRNRVIIDPKRNFARISQQMTCSAKMHDRTFIMSVVLTTQRTSQRTLIKFSRYVNYTFSVHSVINASRIIYHFSYYFSCI